MCTCVVCSIDNAIAAHPENGVKPESAGVDGLARVEREQGGGHGDTAKSVVRGGRKGRGEGRSVSGSWLHGRPFILAKERGLNNAKDVQEAECGVEKQEVWAVLRRTAMPHDPRKRGTQLDNLRSPVLDVGVSARV
jgi:hypothetical protein